MKTKEFKIKGGCQKNYPVGRVAQTGGFTLPEVMVSVALVAVVFVSLYAGISSCFRIVQTNRENVRATQILQEKMEMIRVYNWAQVTNGYIPLTFTAPYDVGTASSLTYTGKVTLANAPITETYGPDMRQIRIQLTWNSGRLSHTREMTSFISRYGLQNYIY